MAFDDINKPTWRGIGASSSLALTILSIYDIATAGWLFTETLDHDVLIDSYPAHYSVFRFTWIAAAILLLALHIYVLYGYATSSSSVLQNCKLLTAIAVVVLVVLGLFCLSIFGDRRGYTMTHVGLEIALLSISFLATLATEAVLMLALVLGYEVNRGLVIPEIRIHV